MVSLVPSIAPSAGALTRPQSSFAAPERLPGRSEQLSFGEFLLKVRAAIPGGSAAWGLGATNTPLNTGQIGHGLGIGVLPTLPTPRQAQTVASKLGLQASSPAQVTPHPNPPPQGGRGLASPVGERIVQTANQFLGSRYVWGGQSPAGFDCTGFTWYVAKQAGIKIPLHDLAGQKASGPSIDRSALEPGDLVFFQNTYQPGLSHVGIALGGGRFIHAASETQGVIVSRLDEPYWAQRFVGATRIGGQAGGATGLGGQSPSLLQGVHA